MVNVVLVVSLIFALVVAIFAVQNNTPVDIAFLGWKYSGISLVLVILGSAVAGAVAVFCLSMVKQFKLKLELRQARVQNDKLNSQIYALEARIPKNEPVETSSVETQNGHGTK
jgi:uncharacterized integral membrane protein